jgi:hypothetical protein
MAQNELEREWETYQRELSRLRQGQGGQFHGHEGEFVLIHGGRVDSFWPTENKGYEEGCRRFGLDPFLVKQVLREEPVIYTSGTIIP